jgi:Domain of unknown function (DUF1990)
MAQPVTPARCGGALAEHRIARDAPVTHAHEGVGPLLQRDYWAVIASSRLSPEQVMALVTADFGRFSPEGVACFTRPDRRSGPLAPGDLLHVDIKGAGCCDVRIVDVDERSLTMRTVEGHPEAGRITFASWRNDDGHLVFRIRSRARAADLMRYVGFVLFGRAVQTQCWVGFIERVAEVADGNIVGEVQQETQEVTDSLADLGGLDTPTVAAPRAARSDGVLE